MIVYAEVETFGVTALVNDKNACEKLYPEMVMEQASLEDIMLFYVSKATASRATVTSTTNE